MSGRIDALLFGQRLWALRVSTLVMVLALLGWNADVRLVPTEPQVRDLAAGEPGFFNASYQHRRKMVALITLPCVEVTESGFVLEDHGFRMDVEASPGHGAVVGESVSVYGRFRPVHRNKTFVSAVRVTHHPLRRWKKGVSGVAAIAVAIAFLIFYRWQRGGFVERERSCPTS